MWVPKDGAALSVVEAVVKKDSNSAWCLLKILVPAITPFIAQWGMHVIFGGLPAAWRASWAISR